MSGATSIEWAHATWNPVRGCSRVSDGCRNCYAERQAARFRGDDDPFHGFAYSDKAGTHWTGRVELVPEALDWPLRTRRPKWVREAEERGERPRVFVNSMSDLFHERLSDEDIAAVFGVMAAKPEWDFLVLTKRPERMRLWFEWAKQTSLDLEAEIGEAPPSGHGEPTVCTLCYDHAIGGNPTTREFADRLVRTRDHNWPLPNVWLGVSVEDQATADERIPLLLQTPAALRFVSYEPALGPIDFRGRAGLPWYGNATSPENKSDGGPFLDWMIVGGESGPGARPFDLAWARSARDQCRAAGVAFYCKQLGAKPFAVEGSAAAKSWSPNGRDGLGIMDDCGQVHLRDRKGGDPSEWPKDLQVRELPPAARSGVGL